MNRRAAMMAGIILLLSGPSPAAIPQGASLVRAWQDYLTSPGPGTPAMHYPHQACFQRAAETTGLPLALLLAVARGESDFNAEARSDRNAYGLMQIQWPGTARHLGILHRRQLLDPCTNIKAGARYLRELLGRYDDNLYLALAAYNYGPGRIPRTAGLAIPAGAEWYSGYIYRHLQYILGVSKSARPVGSAAYADEHQRRVLVFYRPYRARALVAHLEGIAPELRLDWFRLPLNRFEVVLLYRDRRELEQGLRRLSELGVR